MSVPNLKFLTLLSRESILHFKKGVPWSHHFSEQVAFTYWFSSSCWVSEVGIVLSMLWVNKLKLREAEWVAEVLSDLNTCSLNIIMWNLQTVVSEPEVHSDGSFTTWFLTTLHASLSPAPTNLCDFFFLPVMMTGRWITVLHKMNWGCPQFWKSLGLGDTCERLVKGRNVGCMTKRPLCHPPVPAFHISLLPLPGTGPEIRTFQKISKWSSLVLT